MLKKLILLCFVSIIFIPNCVYSDLDNCLVEQISRYIIDKPFLNSLNLGEADAFLYISPERQQMYYFNGCSYKEYAISTAKNGMNIEEGTGGTPWGLHKVDGKIGKDEPVGRVFQSRQPIPKLYSECEEGEFCEITTRILRLRGLEPGVNAGICLHRDDNHSCDSYDRYIYIHGTRDEKNLGKPKSAGCIHVSNLDLVELFDLVLDGVYVYIDKPLKAVRD